MAVIGSTGGKPIRPQPKPKKGKKGQTLEENVETNISAAEPGQHVSEGTFGEAPKPPGPWESGEKTGRWEQGAQGPWESGAKQGPWESGSKVGKWAAGAEGQWKAGGGGGGGGRAGGVIRPRDLIDGTHPGPFRDGNSLVYDGSASDGTTPLDDNGGVGGGGGTGNPLAGVASALKSTSIKSSKLEGMSVEEAVRGARRTRKTGAKRAE